MGRSAIVLFLALAACGGRTTGGGQPDSGSSDVGSRADGGSEASETSSSPARCANGIGQCLPYSVGVCEQVIIGGVGCGADLYCCVVAP